jgi:very-short-patch-repair endonuclease
MLPGARELAAVLAVNGFGLVGYQFALALWGVVAQPQSDSVDLIVVGRTRHSRDGIRVHRVADLPSDERRLKNGIPVTSPARTLLDFASQAREDELECAIAEAYALELTNERELQRVLERHPFRSGAAALKGELKRERGPALTRSKAEQLMKLLVREAGLPAPLVNKKVAGFKADFLWPGRRLIVEEDGFRFHGSRRAFERDRKRDAAHILAGYRVIRITWRQLTEERVAVAVTIARALEVLPGPWLASIECAFCSPTMTGSRPPGFRRSGKNC